MCDFNALDTASKLKYHQELLQAAEAFGGQNFFLQLLEAIRKSKPHPLVSKNCEFKFSRGKVSWDKVIFNDKLALLLKVRLNESDTGNLLPSEEDKSYKKIMNLLRTLKPIHFTVYPKNRSDGEGFNVHAFDIIDAKTTRLNPLFDALFFCAIETVKKVLSYEPKA
ncbi:MAG TPA: hypothetical protein ENK65_03300 [Helicobacteraceae bacterium]|nr:hypothetical protein [Helicobacteraceae bacterium]